MQQVSTIEVTPESLHAAHYVELVRTAALMVDSRSLAEEIVQDCFAGLISRWHTVAPATALAYLRRSVVNGCHSALRRRRTARAAVIDPLPDVPGADDQALRAAGHQGLLDAISRLPLRQRQVVVLRYYSDLSVSETAAALGIRAGAVSTSLRRALRTLALDLGEMP